MRKLFTFAFTLLAFAANAQQVDGDFDQEWSPCKPWDSAGNTTEKGTQPANWIISNVCGINGLGATQVGEMLTTGQGDADPNYSVKLTNTANPFMATEIVPAYISLGTTWATAVSMPFPVHDADGGTFGGLDFSYQPDSIKLYYTRAHGTANATEKASVIAYLWKGTYTQAGVPGNTALMENTVKTVDMVDRDRNILGIETTTGGEVSQTEGAECIAKVEYYIEGDQEEWTELTIPFEYMSESAPQKLNIIISANDYFADRASIGVDNELCVDNVSLVYNSELASLTYDGQDVFVAGQTAYDLSDKAYDETKLTCTSNGRAATIEKKSYDEATGVLTITVKGDDWSEENKNEHVYTIQFKTAVTTNYTNGLAVSINGQTTAPQETTIQLIAQTDGTYSFALKNFCLGTMGVGNIQLDNLTLENGKISTSQGIQITDGDDPNITSWMGPTLTAMSGGSIPVELEATVDEARNMMTAKIAINMAVLQQMINVTFAPSLTVNSETSIADGLSGLYNVTLNRTFAAGWNTVCLPFATTVATLGAEQAQAFTGYSNNVLNFKKVADGTLEANTPYLIYFEKETEVPTYGAAENFEAQTVAHGKVSFTGNYTARKNMEGLYGVADQNGSQYIMMGGANSTLGSTSAYFTVAGAQANAMRIQLEGGATAIDKVTSDGETFDVYTLGGVKVRENATGLNGLQKGIYIVNGKKVVVK